MAMQLTSMAGMAGIIGGGSLRVGVEKPSMAVNSKRKRETCIDLRREKKQRMDCNSTDYDTSWKLRREVKVLLGAEEGKVKAGRIAIKGRSSLNTTFKKGDVPMSPKKALRAALLKKRFADIIFKATHQKLLDHSDNLDPLKWQQERERLEREKQEEKAKIDAQIKAAKAASWRREQEDLKMRCEKERKAARMALEKIEKSVEINDNVGILKNLEVMSCRYLYYPIDANRMRFDGIRHGSPLEQLGLYLKDDHDDVFEEEDDDVILIGEEGEILS